MTLCRYLRWKSFYGQDWQSEAHVAAVLEQNEVPYHCLLTCRPWGPDDEEVTPENCRTTRACFVLSQMVPQSNSTV